MSSWDLEVNRDVRKVLIRHWIDLGKVSIRSANGRVWIRGSLQRIAGVKEELTAAILDNMFAELKRIRGVVAVNPEFDNWTMASGKWQSMEKSRSKSAVDSSLRGSQGGVQELSDHT